jgi:hypothetical protein
MRCSKSSAADRHTITLPEDDDMASNKRKAGRRQSRRSDQVVRRAAVAGRAAAQAALELRDSRRAARKRRAAQIERAPRRARQAAAPTPRVPAKTRALLGPKPTAGVLIAEGDSWFDYPGQDVLGLLEDEHLFDVESVAHKGDCAEDMAHSPGQFAEFARRLEKLLRDDKVPRAILLSGGGNDIAGEEFAILLNHAASGLPALNEDIIRGVIDVRLRAAYVSMISGLTTIVRKYLNRPIPIVTHGYDYAIPDGRGFLGGFLFLPGPWLEPGFRSKGYEDLETNKTVVVQLIDRFNAMLADVSAHPPFAHVHYLNLRKTLYNGSGYKTHWSNELHPSKAGFKLVAQKFADLILRL